MNNLYRDRSYPNRDSNRGRSSRYPRREERSTGYPRYGYTNQRFNSAARYDRGDRRFSRYSNETTARQDFLSSWNKELKDVDFYSLPALQEDAVRIIPLGGLGEIGKNANLFVYQNRAILVDYGILFPDLTKHFGVNLVSPNIEAIKDYLKLLSGIFLTHGHEDHVGALPFILKNNADVPVYATKYTAALMRIKFQEFGLNNVDLREVELKQNISTGGFTVTFFNVTHSIPDAAALLIRAGNNTILNTGDFKLDSLPIDRKQTDIHGILETLHGEDIKLDLAMVDSTNAEVVDKQKHESNILNSFIDIFSKHRNKRIILTCFASHVHRIQQAITVAEKFNRKVCLVGHSMMKTLAICKNLKYLKVQDNMLLQSYHANKIRPSELLVICTGSQGEPMSSLYKMANSLHDIKITSRDVLILSSSVIPGNETAIYAICNKLIKLGVSIYHGKNSFVHVSGHANASELMFFLSTIKPKNLLPIHGEWKHLKALAEIGERIGMPKQNVALLENGVALDLRDGEMSICGKIPADPVYISPWGGRANLSEDLFIERKKLANYGFILVVIGYLDKTPTVDIHPYGTVDSMQDERFIAQIKADLKEKVKSMVPDKSIKLKVKSYIEVAYGFNKTNKPEIIVLVSN